jgi:hypothetical protein
MKKSLFLIALAYIATSMFAQEQQKSWSDAELKEIILAMFCTDHTPPIENDENGNPIERYRPTIQDVANKLEITPEQMARVVEEMIRERLPVVEKNEDNFATYMAKLQFEVCIPMLETFHNANSLALLKECALLEDKTIRDTAIMSYAAIAGADSIPFLREALAEGRIKLRWHFDRRLEEIATRLREKNNIEDADKFIAFINEKITPEHKNPTENISFQNTASLPPVTINDTVRPISNVTESGGEPSPPVLSPEPSQPHQEEPIPSQDTATASWVWWHAVLGIFLALGICVWVLWKWKQKHD